jgi:hypothetical protein
MEFFSAFQGGAPVPAFYDIRGAESVYQHVLKLRNESHSTT